MTTDTTRTVKRVALIVAALAALAAVGFVTLYIMGGGLFANEMACSEGEAPANTKEGGSACFKEGSDLPPGFIWDPRGNHKIN